MLISATVEVGREAVTVWSPDMVFRMVLTGLAVGLFWVIVVGVIVMHLEDWERRHHGGRHGRG